MIARFRILLPFTFSVREGDDVAPFEFVKAPYRVKVYSPCQAAIDPSETKAISRVPVRQSLDGVRPADKQNATDAILMDGTPTIQANLLQVDFVKEDFDRRRQEEEGIPTYERGDPSIVLVFEVVNNFLTRMRALTRGGQIKPLGPNNTFWRLDYLTDNQEELPHDPKLRRRELAATVRFRTIGVNKHIWTSIEKLPADFRSATWDNLLLDAGELLPDVGPSIVVAYAALETFISWCIGHLARSANLPPGLWEWIEERDKDHYKQPSVSEGFDVLLRIFTNRSLKDEPRLWECFRNLQSARHSFVHEGRPMIGGEEVSVKTATRMVSGASEVIDWVERLLPEASRRPRLDRKVEFSFQRA